MDDYTFFDEIRIPPREEVSARLSFENARVSVRFYMFGQTRVRPNSIRDPLLARLARMVRGDGSIAAADCLAFLDALEQIDSFDRPPVTVETAVYYLTPVEPPACPVLNFIFDGNDALTPLMQADDVLYSYDGQGVFLSEDGAFFSMPETRVIDPYLNRDRVLPAMAFSMFYRRTYPILEKEERFRLYSSLRPVGLPPVRIAPRLSPDGELAVDIKWCVPYPEIRFFSNAGMLCECRGELRPAVPALATLPRPMQQNGAFSPDRAQYQLLQRLSHAMPEAFEAPLPAYPAPRPAALSAPAPKQETRKKETIPLPVPAGASVTITPAAPVFNNRGASLERFMRAYGDTEGEATAVVAFEAFSPDWAMLNEPQRRCYLYLRTCYLKGEKAPRAGYAYLLLLIYEAVNHPDRLEFLLRIWEENREEYRRLDMLMPALVRDYIALYTPQTPLSAIHRRIAFNLTAVARPEMYLDLSSVEEIRSLPPALMMSMTGYDVTKSKFYSPETAPLLFDAFGRAFTAADRAHRKASGKGLFESFPAQKITLRTMAMSAAVTTAANSMELVYRYPTSFYNPALREELTLLIKAAENELRIQKGVSGRLRVTGLDPALAAEVRDELREKKKTVRLKVDISAALSIEKSSWNTTDKLIAAAGTEESPAETAPEEPVWDAPPQEKETVPEEPAEKAALTGYPAMAAALSPAARGYLKLLLGGAEAAEITAFAAAHAVMPETLEEEINEKAGEFTGDILIENGEIIEDYRAELPDI